MRLLRLDPESLKGTSIDSPTTNPHNAGQKKVGLPDFIWQPLLAFIWLKVWTSLVLAVIRLTVPGEPLTGYPRVDSVVRALQETLFNRLFLAPWYRFDTVHYLEIAGGGYFYPTLAAWAPLYPLLIRQLSNLGIFPLAAALIISNLACALAFILLFYLAELTAGKKAARLSLLGLVCFPSAFFLLTAYTEALFLVFSLAFFILLFKKHWFWAGLCGAAAALTRFQGAALALPAAWVVWRFLQDSPKPDRLKTLCKGSSPLWPVLLPPAALLAWLAWLHFGLNQPLPWEILGSYWGQHSGFPWEGILGNLSSLAGLRSLPNNPISLIAQFYDLLLICLALLISIISIRNPIKTPTALTIYLWATLLTILVKVDNHWQLVSASRYLLSAFPLFLIFSQTVRRTWLKIIWLGFGFLSQVVLVLCFYFWIWVG